jgi:hypothetical protein
VTAAFSTGTNPRALIVEVHTGVTLDATPVTDSVNGGSGAPTDTIVTEADGSTVTWANGDWTQQTGTAAYRSSAIETATHTVSGQFTIYTAYQTAGAAGSQTYGLTTPTGQTYTMAALELLDSGGPTRESMPVSLGATAAWIAPASSTTIVPVYPADDANDLIVATLAVKPDTATVNVPANWTAGGSVAVGGGTQGAGTGACDAILRYRVSDGSLSGGSQAFTITSGSSPVAHMKAWKYNATDYTDPQWEPIGYTFYSRTTASTTFGGTGASNLNLAAGDVLAFLSISADDQSSTHTISNLTAAGCTFGSLVQSPAGTIVNSQGNDISAAYAYATVLTGPSSAAPVATVSGSTSETGGGIFFRIRATGIAAGSATLTGTAALTQSSTLTVSALREALAAIALSQSNTLTTAGIVTRFGAVALTQSQALTSAATISRLGVVALTQSNTLTTDAILTRLGAVALTQSATLTTAALVTELAAATLTQSATLTIGAVPVVPAAAPLTQSQTLTTTGTVGAATASGAAALTQSSTLTTAATLTRLGAVALTQSNTLTTTAITSRLGAVALSQSNTLVTTSVLTRFGAAALSQNATLTIPPVVFVIAGAALSQSETLTVAGTVTGVGTSSAALTQSSTLVVSALVTELGAAPLTQTATLVVSAVVTKLGAVALTQTNTLTVSAIRGVVTSVSFTQSSTLSVAAGITTLGLANFTQTTTLSVGATVSKQGAVQLTQTSTLTISALAGGMAFNVDVISIDDVSRVVTITEIVTAVVVTEAESSVTITDVSRTVDIAEQEVLFMVQNVEGELMQLPRKGREFYRLIIVTDPPITTWEASFDSEGTWATGEAIAGGVTRWLVRGPNFDNSGTQPASQAVVSDMHPKIRAVSNPEVIIRVGPQVTLV